MASYDMLDSITAFAAACLNDITLVQPCGGAIPLCMVDEFDIPAEIIDRKVTKMKMISPSNREVDVGKTLSETEYIGMCRREVCLPLTQRVQPYARTSPELTGFSGKPELP